MRNELSDGKIRIRRYRTDDTDALFNAVRESIPELIVWMPWCHEDYSKDESREWVAMQDNLWESGTEYNFLIEDAGTGEYLGGCGINRIDHMFKCGTLGYWVKNPRTRDGIATTASRLVVRFGFEDLSFMRIEIFISTENRASQRVAEKLGALKEGTLRNRVFVNGKPGNAILYSLIPEDIAGKRQV